MNLIEGNLIADDFKIGIVASRFNEFIVSKLVDGALDGLKRHGVLDENIDCAYVPGAFEIPLIAKKMVMSNKYYAVICLGAVIKGSTPLFVPALSIACSMLLVVSTPNIIGIWVSSEILAIPFDTSAQT